MKGMRKISRGKSFKGVMKYAFDGDLDNPRELEGEVVGGNVTSRDPQGLTKEFNVSRAVRPDVKNAVWHNSLRLPEGDQVSKEIWSKIGDRYMEKMGFSDAHQRVYVLHDDKEGQHIHVVASRVALDGKLFLGKNENLKSTRVIAELEKEFNLTITKGVSYDEAGKIVMPAKSKVSKNEMEKALRTGTEPPRVQLQKLVDQALVNKPSVIQFVERLQAAGVDVVPNVASTGKLNGFQFGLDGVFFSGSKLGDNYKYSKLQIRGLTYDQERESGFLRELSAEAAVRAERGGAAKDARAPGSGADRTINSSDSRYREDLRGADGSRTGDFERSPGADHHERPGRGERSEYSDREGRRAVDAVDQNAEGGRPRAENAAGTATGRERPSSDDHHRTAKSDIAGHDGSTAEISTGVEISDAGFIRTGDKGSDELLAAAHKNRLKGERERIAADRKKWDGHGENVQKTLDTLRRPYAAALSRTATIGQDAAAYRAGEIREFAQALGVKKLEIVCRKEGAKSVSAVVDIDQLEQSSALHSMARLSARQYEITVQPAPDTGLVVLKGLNTQDLEKLEVIGLGAAAAVDFAGKKDAWINVGTTLTFEERSALTQRLSALVQKDPKVSVAGRLPGFSGATAEPRSRAIAPAASALLVEIKAEAVEAKASQQLTRLVDKNAELDRARDIRKIGDIPSLRSGWLSDKIAAVRDDTFLWKQQPDPAAVERGVVAAMARHKVPAHQAYRAVLDESSVARGDAHHAAEVVAKEYTRLALQAESKPEKDLQDEAQKRYAELYKRAELGTDAELRQMQEKSRADAQDEQRRLDAEAEQKRLALLAKRAAERLDGDLDSTPGLKQ